MVACVSSQRGGGGGKGIETNLKLFSQEIATLSLDVDMPPPHTPGSVGAPSYKENTAAARRDALNPKALNPKP